MIDKLTEILREVGTALMDLRAAGPIRGDWVDASQLKTDADLMAHRMICNALGELAPGVPVISEEDVAGQTIARPDRYWLIDPIDGTASFAGGFDGFVTQAALMHGKEPVQAVVVAPALDLVYQAERSAGASLDGIRLNLAEAAPNRTILIDNYPEPRGTAAAAHAEMGMTGYVESGSIALKICRVADGTADLFFKDVILRDWDVAPGQLILAEAGGHLTGIDGAPFVFAGDWVKPGLIAATNRDLMDRFLAWHAPRVRRGERK